MERLRQLRTNAGLTTTKLGDILGVTHVCIVNWEAGKREPRIEMLKKLSKLFNVTIDYLVENE